MFTLEQGQNIKMQISEPWFSENTEREHLYVYFKCQITRKSATNPQYNQHDQKIDGSLQNASHSWLANNCCEW